VSNRRWNLVVSSGNGGIVVKMPEKNFDKAYEKIALLHKRRGIFKRKLTSVDVRYDNRVVVDIDKSVEDLMLR
jgi:cell division septal protein FtsQ